MFHKIRRKKKFEPYLLVEVKVHKKKHCVKQKY